MNFKKCMTAINDIEDLNFRLSCGVGMLSAVHEAMVYGTLDAGEWKDALFGIYEYLSSVQEEIQKAVDDCYEQNAAGRGGHGNE